MIQKMRINHNEKGFTLIELMIVIAIIGILAAIAIPQFAAYRRRAWTAELQSAAHTLANAQEAYFADFSNYADDPTDLTSTPDYGAMNINSDVDITTANWSAVGESFSFTVSNSAHTDVPVVSYESAGGGLIKGP